MRTFVALEIPDKNVVDSIVEVQKKIAQSGAEVKLVERENIHFTVKFLGELSDELVARADSLLRARPPSGANVEVRGVGAFPDVRRPNVIWVGLSAADEPKVAPIAEFVRDCLNGIGERDDRPFKAHATVARVRSARNLGGLLGVIRENQDRLFGRVGLRTIKLKSSRLTPQGPIYSDVGAYPLA